MNRLPTVAIEPSAATDQERDADFNSIAAQFKRLVQYLDLCCQQHTTRTYLEVADAIDVQAPRRIHQLTKLLEALMEHDQRHHQPQRAALVVSRNRSGLPAQGFFLKAQALGLISAVTDEEFHQQCLDYLFDGPAATLIEAE